MFIQSSTAQWISHGLPKTEQQQKAETNTCKFYSFHCTQLPHPRAAPTCVLSPWGCAHRALLAHTACPLWSRISLSFKHQLGIIRQKPFLYQDAQLSQCCITLSTVKTRFLISHNCFLMLQSANLIFCEHTEPPKSHIENTQMFCSAIKSILKSSTAKGAQI